MTDQYLRDVMRATVAQICQTIGYNGTQTTPLELLQDISHKFLHEFARDLRRQVEHYNRTEVNLNDAYIALKSLNINVSELVDYINNVEPVPCSVETPKFPVNKESHLNFLKRGSREVLTRPVHIFEYLPPILPPEPCELPTNSGTAATLIGDEMNEAPQFFLCDTEQPENSKTHSNITNGSVEFTASEISTTLMDQSIRPLKPNSIQSVSSVNKSTADNLVALFKTKAKSTAIIGNTSHFLDEEGRPTREISSVVMTTGGFISPAIEGKLPDTIIPDLIEKLQGFDAPPPPILSPPPLLQTPTTAVPRNLPEIKPETDANKALAPQTATAQIKNGNGNNITKSCTESAIPSPAGTADDIFVLTPQAGRSKPGKKLNAFDNNSANVSILTNSAAMATKLLKKARKNNSINPQTFANLPIAMSSKYSRCEVTANAGAPSSAIDMENVGTEKTKRKRMKILQKIKKSKAMKSSLESTRLDALEFHSKNIDDYNKYLHKLTKKHTKQLEMEMRCKASLPTAKCDALSEQRQPSPAYALDGIMRDSVMNLNASNINGNIAISDGTVSSTSATPANAITCEPQNIDQKIISTLPHVNTYPSTSKEDVMPTFQPSGVEAEDAAISKPAFENKLSNEPDRSKLNIFKKISKQKGNMASKATSPSTPANSNATTIYGNNNNQVINLPSGTTITPAPPVSGTAPASATDMRESDVLSSVGRAAASTDARKNTADAILFAENAAALINKPKKRGRKPGSKNQAKLTTPLTEAVIDAPIYNVETIPKSIIRDMHLKNLMMNEQNNTEPLNLTNSQNSDSSHVLSTNYSALSDLTSEKSFSLFGSRMREPAGRRKEVKKFKMNKTTTRKKNPNVPTKEEVSFINKKLMRMDTVLKPAPLSTPPMHDFMQMSTLQAADFTSGSSKSPGFKKRQLHPQYPDDMSTLSTAAAAVGIPYMMSMYPFAPRPGLIPAPGLFPTPSGLGNFSSNSNKAAASPSNMLLQPFLPFHNLKPATVTSTSASSKLIGQEGNNNERDKSTLMASPKTDRSSYCNVAPLVPESMKLISPTEPKQQQSHNEREDIPKTPKLMQLSPTSWKNIDKLNVGVGSGTMSVMETNNSSTDSKSIPQTPGGISLKSYEALTMRSSVQINNNIKIPPANLQDQPTLMNVDEPIEVSDDSMDAANTTTLRNVSSTSQSVMGLTETTATTKLKLNQNSLKLSNISSVDSYMDDIFAPNSNNNNKIMTITDSAVTGLNPRSSKGIKKLKKPNKLGKQQKHVLVYATGVQNSRIFGSDGNTATASGVGKLAGGADLIPLRSTGLAYSSKTIPANSLTAGANSNAAIALGGTATTNTFSSATVASVLPRSMLISDNISIIPAHTAGTSHSASVLLSGTTLSSTGVQPTGQQKKRKEHKKIKKLKEGRIKKKKDKKDKSKSKEHRQENRYLDNKNENKLWKENDFEKYNQHESHHHHKDKDISRKLKKEKKKDKQRQMDVLDTTGNLISNSVDSLNKTTAFVDKEISEKLKPLPSASLLATSSSVGVGSSATTLVPKLTLKFACNSSQSPPVFEGDNLSAKTIPSTSLSSSATSASPVVLFTPTSAREKRDPSPELARISPLVTRPPKQKLNAMHEIGLPGTSNNTTTTEILSDSITNKVSISGVSTSAASNNINSNTTSATSHSCIPLPTPWLSGGTLAASSVLLPQQLLQASSGKSLEHQSPSAAVTVAETPATTAASSSSSPGVSGSVANLISDANRPSSYIDADGNRIWICPACGKVDDGSPMIGCDGCDAWYHWVCVGIFVAPKDNEDWFCRVCITRKKGIHTSDKKRKRNKKK